LQPFRLSLAAICNYNVADIEINEAKMVASSMPIFIENVLQHMALVWVELTLASIAAIAYFTLAGWARKSKGAKIKSSSGSPKQDGKERGNDADLTPTQHIIKVLRQGKLIEAVDLLQELPETNRHRWGDCDAAVTP